MDQPSYRAIEHGQKRLGENHMDTVHSTVTRQGNNVQLCLLPCFWEMRKPCPRDTQEHFLSKQSTGRFTSCTGARWDLAVQFYSLKNISLISLSMQSIRNDTVPYPKSSNSITSANKCISKLDYYVNMCGRFRDCWGRFTGEISIFRKAAEGLFVPAQKTGPAGLRGLASTGGAPMWGDPPETSNESGLECRCRGAGAHISSLRPGVSGVKTNPAISKSAVFVEN